MPLSPGTRLGRYEVVRLLGAGGMGEVYLANHERLQRDVALKVLPTGTLADEAARKRFRKEALALSKLNHPNIATVYDFDTQDGVDFLVMEYIPGTTLDKKVAAGSLPEKEVVRLGAQLVDGLTAAHDHGVLYRDLKPANLRVTPDGRLKILDFGLAKLLRPVEERSQAETATETRGVVGTPPYMAPEQLRGETVDTRTDIWAVGIVLYEMAGGQRPFRGETPTSLSDAILHQSPITPRAHNSRVSPDLERIVLKCLEKEPENRYQSAKEVGVDLRRLGVLETTPVVATVSQIGAQIALRLRLDSRRAWIAAVAVVVVILGVFIFYPNSAVPFVERDWIVIADFENLTGDDVFDHSLDMALSVSLSQSQYVNVFPRRRAEQAITRMKLKDVDRIDETTGREIAVREGVRILVVPTISGVGDNYALTGAIQDTETGENLRMEMVRADGKDEVLDALDDLANKIREDLGEAKRSISLKSKPLKKVTTSSLEALKRYSMGFEKQQQGQFEESRRHYGYAVENDSEFAMALGALGMVEYLHFDRVKGLDYFNRAIEYADQITEPEAYSLRAAHAIAVEEDYEKAAQIYSMAAEEYPDASTYHNNLGAVYGLLGRHQDAADEYKEAIRAEPTLMIAYNGLVTEYMIHLGRVDLALEWSRRQMAYQPESSWPYYNLAYVYIGADSIDNAIEALGRSLEFDLEFAVSLELLGHTLLLLGLYDDALTAYAHLLEATPDAVEPHYYMGIASELLGQNARARDYYGRFAQITQWRIEDQPDNPYYYIDLGIVRTRMGQNDRARAAAARATAIDPTAHLSYARLSSVQGNADNSLEHVVRAIDGGYRDLIYVKFHPDFQLLRNDPRLTELLDRHLKK